MTPPSPTVTDATTTAGAAGPRLVAGRGELSGAVTRALRSGTAPVYAPGAVLKADGNRRSCRLSTAVAAGAREFARRAGRRRPRAPGPRAGC